MRHLTHILITLVMLASSGYIHAQCGTPAPMLCDADGDRDVDQNDIRAIGLAKGTPASGAGDIRDVDRDGTITIVDARQCVSHCTTDHCAPPDVTPPNLIVDTPQNGATLNVASVTVSGRATDDDRVDTVTVNSVAANLVGDTFTQIIALVEGQNTITVIAKDASGNATSTVLTVIYDANTSTNLPPVARAQATDAVLSHVKVALDGSASYDPDGYITTYNWIQTAGPVVDVDYFPSQPTASFTAPSVATDTTLQFQLQVDDDKGDASTAEVAVEVIPVESAQLQVEFIGLRFLKPSANQDEHANFFPVPGPPIANEQIRLMATLSGLIKTVSFEFRDLSDSPIGQASLTRLGESENPPFDFGGEATIPDQPFTVAAIGTTYNGQNFDVSLPTEITPERYRVLFTPRLIELPPGGSLPITLLIENGGPSDTFDIEFSDPHGLLDNSYDTTLQIDADTTQGISLEIIAPQSPPALIRAPLRVSVAGQSNPSKKLEAELLLTVEDAP